MGTFIDIFAGCGGLSLGLIQAGWKGVFAVEKNLDAFKTLKTNLIDNKTVSPFEWPDWLPCEALTVENLLSTYADSLLKLRGKIDLVAGCPPCQGFSFAGKRNEHDERNNLSQDFLAVVEIIQPKTVLLENVKGFKVGFKGKKSSGKAVYIAKKLKRMGYTVFSQIINALEFGVPQSRQRFILIAIKKENKTICNPFTILNKSLPDFKRSKGLITKRTTTREAISDLEVTRVGAIPHKDGGYLQINYKPDGLTTYQKLMRENATTTPNSLRLANHSKKVVDRFTTLLNSQPKGKNIALEDLRKLGTKKQCLVILNDEDVCRTITTLPDDLIHYSEPRILTARETARVQSFPDWFEFTGSYTTGGKRRKNDCPRYTQIGNAVPPLMAECIGAVLLSILHGYPQPT